MVHARPDAEDFLFESNYLSWSSSAPPPLFFLLGLKYPSLPTFFQSQGDRLSEGEGGKRGRLLTLEMLVVLARLLSSVWRCRVPPSRELL